MVECNDTAVAYPRDLTFPHLFARQAAKTPGAIAIVAGAQSLTYRELEQRSDALARRLISLGFGPNARVGVFVNRTADLVIAPLAILKAGNAYVPLDPTYPPGRLTQIIEQSGLVAILAQSEIVPLSLRSVPIVAVDNMSEPGTTAELPTLPSIRPEDTAYVIFTSGSTGQPKGVQIPHRALTNFLCAMRGTPGFAARDTIVAVTTICFDIAALELFLPLTVGANVVIAGEEETRDGPPAAVFAEAGGGTRSASDAGDVGAFDRSRLARRSATEDAVRRRGAAPPSGGSAIGPQPRAVEHVRADGDDHLVVSQTHYARRRPDPDRAADRQHAVLYP